MQSTIKVKTKQQLFFYTKEYLNLQEINIKVPLRCLKVDIFLLMYNAIACNYNIQKVDDIIANIFKDVICMQKL